jgi:integrase
MGVSVRQKTDGGPWWIFVKHRGKRTSKYVGEKKAADKLAKQLREALAAGDLGLLKEPEEKPHVITFGEYADRYLRDAEQHLKHSTWVDYDGTVRAYLRPAFGERALAEIARRDVKDLAMTLRRTGLKPKSVRKIIGTLSSILSEAVDDEILPSNPALQLRNVYRSPEFTAGDRRKSINPLTREELAHLLATARDFSEQRGETATYPFRQHYPFLLTLARTGLRSLSMRMRQSVCEFSVEPPLFMIDSVTPRGLIAVG